MPELPDLTFVAEAFHAALVGRPIAAVAAPGPLAVRGTPAELEALVGQRVTDIRRRGKFLLVDLDRDRVVVNPMLTGRFQLARPDEKQPTKTAVVLSFGARADAAEATRRLDETRDLDAGRRRDRRGSLPRPDADGQGLPVAGRARAARVPGLADTDLGPDADDPALTLDVWRQRIRRHPGRAQEPPEEPGRSSPASATPTATRSSTRRGCCPSASGRTWRRRRSTLSTRRRGSTLTSAIDVLRRRVPPTFEKQVRDFLAVHDKGGTACPRCGTKISEVKPGGFVTSFCRGCQR